MLITIRLWDLCRPQKSVFFVALQLIHPKPNFFNTNIMDQNNATQPQGKGLAVAGFVIALVALVFYFIIAGVVTVQAALGGGYGLGIFWLILSLAGTAMCVMGMMKLGKTGGKKGLAIAGMIIGLVALILSALLVMGIGAIQEEAKKQGSDFSNKLEEAMKDMENAK